MNSNKSLLGFEESDHHLVTGGIIRGMPAGGCGVVASVANTHYIPTVVFLLQVTIRSVTRPPLNWKVTAIHGYVASVSLQSPPRSGC